MNVTRRKVLEGIRAYATLALLSHVSRASAAPSLSVRDYGAKGDGKSDDTQSFTTALAALPVVTIPPGRYVVGDLVARSNQVLRGAGNTSALIQKPSSQYLLSVNPGRGGTPNVEENSHDISIEDLSFHGAVTKLGFDEHCHLLNVNACSRLDISRCSFSGFRGDAIYLGSSNVGGLERHNRDIRIHSCTFDGVDSNNRNAISVIDCDGLSIAECVFTNCSRPDMPGAIDIEPNQFTFHRINGVVITRNRFIRCSGGVGNICLVFSRAKMSNPPTNIIIEANVIDGNSRSNGLALLGAEDARSAASAIEIRKNTVRNTRAPLLVRAIGDVSVVDNVFVSSEQSALLLPASSNVGVRIHGNTFKSLGRVSGVGVRVSGGTVEIKKNVFEDCGYADKRGGVALQLENRGQVPDVEGNQFVSSAGYQRTAIHLTGFDTRTHDSFLRGNSFARNVRPLQ